MSWQDRPYAHGNDPGAGGSFGGGGPGMAMSFPRPGPVVKWLLILNFAGFAIQAVVGIQRPGALSDWLAANAADWWQVWRYVTFQFLHGGVMHLGLNMLGLYMLGTPVEQRFGSKRFLQFYLLCGVMAGVAYVLMMLLMYGPGASVPIVGASGGVYGIIVAAAVYFPHFVIVLMFFPMKIRAAAAIIFGIMVLTILHGLAGGVSRQFWSHVAHFGGAATAAVWVWLAHNRPALGAAGVKMPKVRKGNWSQKIDDRKKTLAEVDRILEKVHRDGIASLTPKEKRILKRATELQREDDERVNRL